jgi:hypothetical protein
VWGDKGLGLVEREIAAGHWKVACAFRGAEIGNIAHRLSFRIRLRGVRWKRCRLAVEYGLGVTNEAS